MQTQILEQDTGRAKIQVDVPAADVSRAYQQVLSSIARQIRVPGFRPGKAPRGVIESRVGKDAIAQEVRDALVQTYFPQAVRELSLVPVAQHLHAHEPVDGEDYAFEAELELYPEFELPDVSQIVLDSETPPLTDEMVQETIDALRTQNATLIPVERSAEAGDYLMVETVSADGSEGSSIPVDLENVAPELAEQFLGKAIGDEIELKLADESTGETADDPAHDHDQPEDETDKDETETPEASADEAPAEPSTLRVRIKDVRTKERPEADDEFAQTLGFETWAEADTQIRDNLRAQLEQDALNAQQEEFTEKLLLETQGATVPPSLKARRRESLLQNLVRDLGQRNLTLEGYLASLDEDKRKDFERELEENAENAVKRDLVLEKLLEQRGTNLSNEEFDAALAYTAQRQGGTPQKVRQELGDSGLTNYRFLLTRDKAVRETVQELLAAQRGEALPSETVPGETPPSDTQASDKADATPVESDV
jgi:trigger factor